MRELQHGARDGIVRLEGYRRGMALLGLAVKGEEEEAWVDSEGVREATPAASEEKDAAAQAMSSQPERSGPSPRREEKAEEEGEGDRGSEGGEERAEASPKGAGEDEGGGGGDSPRRGVTKSAEEERERVREVGGGPEKRAEAKEEEESAKREEERKTVKKEAVEERETILVKNEDEEDVATPGGGNAGVAESSAVPRGSPNSASVISSPPSHPPRVRLNPSLATDPAIRGPLPLSTHIPLTDFEYMLPPGLQASTAAAAAAAAFAAAGRFFFPPPPHPATPRVPPTTPPHPIQTPIAEAAPALATRTASIQPEGLEVRQVPVYVCAPCGIKFSSASTLEAHQTYYCTHRNSVIGGAVVPGGAAAVHPGHSPAAPAPAGTPGPPTTPSSRPPPSPSSSSSSSSHATMAQTDAQQIRSVPTPSGPIRGRGGGSESEDARPFSAEVAEDRRSPSSLPEDGCPPAKIPRTSRPFSCPHCSYSADKKVSLNRHMRMHGGAVIMSSSSSSSPSPSSSTPPPLPPAPSQPPPPPPASGGVATQLHHLLQQGIVVVAGGGAGSVGPRGPDTPPAASSSPPDPSLPPPPPPLAMDRYCQDCDIRFSSVKTYRAHKQHYCSTRHAGGKSAGQGGADGSTSPAVAPGLPGNTEERRLSVGEAGDLRSPGVGATSSAASPSNHLPQVKQQLLQPPFVALPTNPVLLVPYAFLQSASLVVAGTPTPKGACILLPDGSLRPISPPPGAVPPAPSPVRRRTPPAADVVAVHDRGPTQISVTPQQVTAKPKEDNSQTSKPPPGSSPAPLDLSFRRDSSESQPPRAVSTPSVQSARRSYTKQSPRDVDGGWEDMMTASQGRRSSEPGSRGSCQTSPPPSQQPNTPHPATPIDHAHSPTSSTSSSAASSSPPSPATGPKARPSRPNGMSSSSSKGSGGAQAPPPPPHPMFSTTPSALPPHIQQQIQQLQQFGGAAGMESLGMANFLLAACAAAAAATAGGPDGMAKAAAAAVAGAGNAAAQGGLPFLLTPELALRMVMGSAGLPEGLIPRVPPHLPPPQPPIPTQQGPPPPPTSSGPQVLVKQGVSKCVECNIVFCRHENYLAHKKHYCAARLVEGNEESPTATSQGSAGQVQNTGADSVERSTPEPSSSASPRAVPTSPSLQQQAAPPPGIAPPPPPKTLLQFICVACGIKFTAFDNLQAHQMYYCPKRDQVASVQKNPMAGDVPTMERVIRKCPKCKAPVSEEALLSGRHQCPATNGSSPAFPAITAAGGWKCPCCDVLSPTAIAAQRHVETHAGGAVRAFRCTICRYRGNTLRGMRTHIRAHFEQRNREAPITPHSPELQEENFIACILEDDSEVPPMVPVTISIPTSINTSRSTTPATDSDEGRMDSGSGGERMHYCEVCGYSSTYKGNVVRHLKLVHKCTQPGGPTEAGVMGPGIAIVSGSGNGSIHSVHSPGGTPSPTGDSMVNGYGGGSGHRTEDDDEDMEVRAESLVKVEIMEVEEDEGEDGIGKREVKLEGSEAEEERKSNFDREEGNSHDSYGGGAVSPRIIKREAVSSCEEGSMGGDCSKTGSPAVEGEVKKEVEEAEEEEEVKIDDTERGEGEEGRKSADPPQSQQQQPVIKKTKYCKSCDISFNYLSTFIAHKKFYCSSHHPPAQGTTSPAPAIARVERGNHGASGNGRAEAATPVQ